MIEEVLEKIYADLDLALTEEVYNGDALQDAPYPYVILEAMELNQQDTNTETGFDGTFNVHTWSIYDGSQEASTIQKTIYDTLHRNEFDTTNWCLSQIGQQFVNLTTGPDGITRHGVQRFRIQFEPKPV